MRRPFLRVVALLAAACSYSADTAQIDLTVSNIPATADHLNVYVCTAAGACTSDTAAISPNHIYRPWFKAGDASTIALQFASLSAGTVTVVVEAMDPKIPLPIAHGTVSGTVPASPPPATALTVALGP
jgi:hypothetical protein